MDYCESRDNWSIERRWCDVCQDYTSQRGVNTPKNYRHQCLKCFNLTPEGDEYRELKSKVNLSNRRKYGVEGEEVRLASKFARPS